MSSYCIVESFQIFENHHILDGDIIKSTCIRSKKFRTQTREFMADRKLAESLYKTDPNRTWEEMIQRQLDKGITGDDIYKEIIASSHRSRKSVNKSLGLE